MQERCESFNPAGRNAPSYPEAAAGDASARRVKGHTSHSDGRSPPEEEEDDMKLGVYLDVCGDVLWEKSAAGGEQAGPARVSAEARDKDPY